MFKSGKIVMSKTIHLPHPQMPSASNKPSFEFVPWITEAGTPPASPPASSPWMFHLVLGCLLGGGALGLAWVYVDWLDSRLQARLEKAAAQTWSLESTVGAQKPSTPRTSRMLTGSKGGERWSLQVQMGPKAPVLSLGLPEAGPREGTLQRATPGK
jgi:hypothetical protein